MNTGYICYNEENSVVSCFELMGGKSFGQDMCSVADSINKKIGNGPLYDRGFSPIVTNDSLFLRYIFYKGASEINLITIEDLSTRTRYDYFYNREGELIKTVMHITQSETTSGVVEHFFRHGQLIFGPALTQDELNQVKIFALSQCVIAKKKLYKEKIEAKKD